MNSAPLAVTIARTESKIIATAEAYRIEIQHEVPISGSDDFAAFLFLPIAMRLGRPLHIRGAGDPETARNAQAMARTWQLWLPDFFRSVAVSFEVDRVTPAGYGALVLYSSGADSTYNLLDRRRRGETQSLLTVHGLDYGFEGDKRFADLVTMASGFASYVSDEWITVRTDVYSQYKPLGISTGIGHAFALGACLFLFNDRYQAPEISADYTLAQEMLVHPWGTNHVTNALFASSTYRLTTANSDVTRSEKIAALASSPIALESLSFCGEENYRPHNCGRCAKCTRTKAMFLATTGREPAIFLNAGIDAANLARWKPWKRKEGPFFMDFYQAALAGGHLDAMPWFDDLAAEAFDRSTSSRIKRRVRKLLPALGRMIDGRRVPATA